MQQVDSMNPRELGPHRYYTRRRAEKQEHEVEKEQDPLTMAEQRNEGGNGQPNIQDVLGQLAQQQQQMMQTFMQSQQQLLNAIGNLRVQPRA